MATMLSYVASIFCGTDFEWVFFAMSNYRWKFTPRIQSQSTASGLRGCALPMISNQPADTLRICAFQEPYVIHQDGEITNSFSRRYLSHAKIIPQPGSLRNQGPCSRPRV